MADSILNDVKKICSLVPEYTAFDQDLILHINSTLSTLTQLGIGPEDGVMIDDASATWDLVTSDKKLSMVKTYVSLNVRLLFDPPATSYAIDAIKQQLEKLEWRMNVVRESTEWIDPNTTIPDDEPLVLDGGVVT